MRVIPVIDLLNGVVVRGVAGRRHEYRPIRSKLVPDSQPLVAARAFREQFGLESVYVADLDAIQFQGPLPPLFPSVYLQIAAAGLHLWLDAGIGSGAAAEHLRQQLAPLAEPYDAVIGLESLTSPAALGDIVAILGRQRTLFSLDMQAGVLRTKIPRWTAADPVEIAYRAVASGVSRLIVLDLADVGTGNGTRTLDLCRRLRRTLGAAIELTAGGGVRGVMDLLALEDAGCDAALVASALHDGRLTRREIEVAAGRQ